MDGRPKKNKDELSSAACISSRLSAPPLFNPPPCSVLIFLPLFLTCGLSFFSETHINNRIAEFLNHLLFHDCTVVQTLTANNSYCCTVNAGEQLVQWPTRG